MLVNTLDIKAQILLKNNDIIKLTIENFPESIYYKSLKTKPEVQTSFVSAKLIDSGCINYQTMEFDFKKKKISFRFKNNYDSTKTYYLESVNIKGEHTPFITEDSINVGDKVLLKTICKDIDKLKARYSKRNDKYVTCIFYNNITYDIYKTPIEKINSETVVKIKEIYIRTYK